MSSLEQQLVDAGNKLLLPPSSLDELLPLLDQVEYFLSRVEQSPAKSIHDALSPLMKALVVDELLRHSEVDVKIAVASCISEITRITAPDTPYDDDIMRDVFQLIVSSFENLHDKSSGLYSKRVNVLETVAKVRSCVIMLDLECDGLITEMFQHFLEEIRDYHPETIFTYMATIMTLVLEESEEVSPELLTPLLATVKKDSKEVTPIAKKLGETVFANCAPKLKPYLTQTVESLDLSLDEYSKSLTSVLEGTHLAVENGNDGSFRDQLVAESVREEACSDDIDHTVSKSSKSTGNGPSERNGESAAQTEPLMTARIHDSEDLQDVAAKVTSKSDSDDSMVDKPMKSESRSEHKESGRKANSLISSAESFDQAPNDDEKEAEELLECRKNENNDFESSSSDDPAFEGSNSLEKEKEATLQQSTPKESEGEAVNVAPTSPRRSLVDESVRKKGRPKKRKISNKKHSVPKEVSEGTNNLETKQVSRPSEETPSESSLEEKEDGSTGNAEAIPPKQSNKKNEPRVKSQDGFSTKKKDDGKRRGPTKARLEEVPSPDSPDKSAKDEGNQEETPRASAKRKRLSDKDREEVPSPDSPDKSAKDEGNQEETPRASSKRKRLSDKERETEEVKYDASLVGARVKVWWPDDREFYEGVISAFDSRKKKHTVSYDDGETEVLNLKNERWKFVQGDEVSEEEEVASPDASSEVQKKKARTMAEPLAKHVEALPKSNSKGKSTKTGRKSKDEGKLELSLKEGTSKSDERTEDASGSKSKAQSQKSTGKSVDNKASARSNIDSSTSKSKSEQEMPSKTATKSKGKTPQSGSKLTANGTGKAKSSSSKVRETTPQKEKITDSAKTPDSLKAKSSGASKARASESKSGKKRARGKR